MRPQYAHPDHTLITPWPVEMPSNWLERVNRPEGEKELEGLRRSVQRGRPYGTPEWQKKIRLPIVRAWSRVTARQAARRRRNVVRHYPIRKLRGRPRITYSTNIGPVLPVPLSRAVAFSRGTQPKFAARWRGVDNLNLPATVCCYPSLAYASPLRFAGETCRLDAPPLAIDPSPAFTKMLRFFMLDN